MDLNHSLANAKTRMEQQQQGRADTEHGSLSRDETRQAIKLQMKRNIILRNVLASLVRVVLHACRHHDVFAAYVKGLGCWPRAF
jgi:hypothetical protein